MAARAAPARADSRRPRRPAVHHGPRRRGRARARRRDASPSGCASRPIVGYLLAGVVIGPFTPGFVGDTASISELAEVGVVLLLFALGVEFSISKLAPGAPDRRPGRDPPGPDHRRRRGRHRHPDRAACAGGGRGRGCRRDQLHGGRPQAARRARRARQPPWPVGDRLDGRPGPADDPAHRAARAVRRGRRPRRSRRARAAAHGAVPRPRLRRRHADAAVAVPVGRRLGSPELFLLSVFATALLAAFLELGGVRPVASRSARSSRG